MKRLWLSVCLIALTLCCGYAGCTEPRSEAQSLSAQAVCSEDEPGASLHYPKEVVASVSHVQSPFEERLLTEGEPADEELVKRKPLDDEQHQTEAPVLELEQPAEEVVPESVTESETESAFQTEHLLPEASLTADQEAASTLSPSTPTPASGPACSACPDTQDSCPNTLLEQVEADVPVPDLKDADVDAVDCDLTSVPVVLENTSNVHSGGTTTSHTDPALAPSGQGTPGLAQGVNTSQMLKEQGLSSHLSTETDPSPSAKDGEDIPTFDEWKRKVMEVEKEKTQAQAVHTTPNKGSHVVKKVQKNFNNYVSVECGAKILGANPEAKSTSAILMENMDLYMLNPCSNKIWFIIELCEQIQIKQLDIANFELFSSTPKDFLVFISERYPTNKWLKLGTFHGRDERMVQSFPLDEHLYAKYVKVELISHFGSEHFCPFSLIRVFGTSMVEEYEERADPSERADEQDDYFDHPPGYALPPEAKSSNNLIGSAKDVILNMVNNIAVNVLGGGPGSQGNFTVPALNTTKTSTTSELEPTATLSPLLEPVEGEPDTHEHPSDILTEAPIPELALTETPQLPVEDPIVMPSPEDEEEEAYPPVVLLDREEDMEEKEEEDRERLEWESMDYGGDSSTSPVSPSPCCRSASLREHLQQRCLALPAPRRKRSSPREPAPDLPPLHDRTPAPEESSAPSVVFQPPSQPPMPPRERDVPAGRAEGDVAGQPKPQPIGEQEKPRTDPFQLEPSQTCSTLPRPSSSEPSSAVELSRPTSAPHPQTPPEKSQEEKEAEGETRPAPVPTVSSSLLTSTQTSSSAPTEQVRIPPPEERPRQEADPPEPPAPAHPPEAADPPPPPPPFPTVSSPMQQIPPPPPDSDPLLESLSTLESADLMNGHAASTETKMEELEDILFTSSPDGNGRLPPRAPSSSSSSGRGPAQSDYYAELQNATEPGGGNQVHGSGQKESVFMRLNNRIKALEMNMSLSGRYLEQLSQRYRKQMEEMQKAFNKTIIKLQNTSRLAEEQDLRQTESIQTMHGQLHNITQLVLNLTLRVSQLQNEVSDRQSYLLLCLVLGVLLGLLLCAQHCRSSALPPSTDPEPPRPKSYSYCCPDRPFASYDDPGLKRSASYPLLASVDSALPPSTEGPESLHALEPEPHRLNKKKKRGRTKPKESMETLVSSTVVSVPPLANGVPLSNGGPRGRADTSTAAPTGGLSLSHPALKDSPSERSSEGSSHSDEPSFCGIAASCSRICDGLPPAPRTRAAKRAFKRRRSKAADAVMADLMKAPRRGSNVTSVVSVLQDRTRENKELSSGTFGGKALSGPV